MGVTHITSARLVRAEIADFRNIARASLDIPPEGIVVVGNNGHGKTNLLEAVAYLELMRSMRGARDRDLIRFGADVFHIAATLAGTRVRDITVGASRSGEKRVALDGVEQARLSNALGALPSVCVSPADVVLVAGGPSGRRRLLDIVLALTDAAYLNALRHYRSALARRNAALRTRTQGRAAVRAWNAALAAHGATIVRARHGWATQFAGTFTSLTAAIGEHEAMTLRYETTFGANDDIAAQIADALDGSAEIDSQRGATQRGPHRDDLALTLAGRPLRLAASAGQQRTAAIALRLLEARTFRQRMNMQPVLLLDDPFAELDSIRAARVLDLVTRAADHGVGQVLLCVPRPDEIPPAFTRLERWNVESGAFTRRVADA